MESSEFDATLAKDATGRFYMLPIDVADTVAARLGKLAEVTSADMDDVVRQGAAADRAKVATCAAMAPAVSLAQWVLVSMLAGSMEAPPEALSAIGDAFPRMPRQTMADALFVLARLAVEKVAGALRHEDERSAPTMRGGYGQYL